jgi:transposase-like protein
MGTRPAIFKWRQTEAGLILCAVRWYLRYSLSLRNVEELLEERGLHVDHTTIWRWEQDFGPELGSDCEGISRRPTSRGGWTKPTFA